MRGFVVVEFHAVCKRGGVGGPYLQEVAGGDVTINAVMIWCPTK